MKKPVGATNWLNKNRQPILGLDKFKSLKDYKIPRRFKIGRASSSLASGTIFFLQEIYIRKYGANKPQRKLRLFCV